MFNSLGRTLSSFCPQDKKVGVALIPSWSPQRNIHFVWRFCKALSCISEANFFWSSFKSLALEKIGVRSLHSPDWPDQQKKTFEISSNFPVLQLPLQRMRGNGMGWIVLRIASKHREPFSVSLYWTAGSWNAERNSWNSLQRDTDSPENSKVWALPCSTMSALLFFRCTFAISVSSGPAPISLYTPYKTGEKRICRVEKRICFCS